MDDDIGYNSPSQGQAKQKALGSFES